MRPYRIGRQQWVYVIFRAYIIQCEFEETQSSDMRTATMYLYYVIHIMSGYDHFSSGAMASAETHKYLTRLNTRLDIESLNAVLYDVLS